MRPPAAMAASTAVAPAAKKRHRMGEREEGMAVSKEDEAMELGGAFGRAAVLGLW